MSTFPVSYSGYTYPPEARQRILELFGMKCCRCGYDSDVRALQLDHIHRARVPRNHTHRSGYGLYREILKGNISKNDFQLLCANCNWIKKLDNKEHYPIVTSNKTVKSVPSQEETQCHK